MFTIEFDTEIQDGIIKVPDEYVKQLQSHVRVAIQSRDIKKEKKTSRFSRFLSHECSVEKMNVPARVELHER